MNFSENVAKTALTIDSAYRTAKTTRLRFNLKEVPDAYNRAACIVLSTFYPDMEFIPQISSTLVVDVLVVPKTLSAVTHKTLDDPECKGQGESCLERFKKMKAEMDAFRAYYDSI